MEITDIQVVSIYFYVCSKMNLLESIEYFNFKWLCMEALFIREKVYLNILFSLSQKTSLVMYQDVNK